MVRQAEIERELLLARDIQQGLLLEGVPQLRGWEMSAVSLPARDLGGDLYDFLALSERSHGIMIGDVSGKGLPAALRMAVARTVFRYEARRNQPPGVTLAGVNSGVISEIPQGMVTMLYAALDTRSGEIRFANAGHNYPVLIRAAASELELNGLPLGVLDGNGYEEQVAQLDPGDVLLLYTDGITEATDRAEEMYGYERLEQVVLREQVRRPRSLVAALLQELRAWSAGDQADDITIVALRRRLSRPGDELRVAAEDVLGRAAAAQLWEIPGMPGPDAAADLWGEALGPLVQVAQQHHGRGLARELHGQFRLVLDDYR